MNKKNRISIFIVEDDKLFTMALKADIESTFEYMHIETQTFETGEKCMENFRDVKPRVVILDYNLNSKVQDAANGIKVLDWIKKVNPETNVIMLTSEDNIDIAIKSFMHGASDYVVKTETKFKKINYSLFNLFKLMKAKMDAKRFKYMFAGAMVCFALVFAVTITIQLYFPSILE